MGLIADNDDGQKPLFRKWYRQQKKEGYIDSEIRDTVERVKLSGSEEWLIVEGQESVALINADSKVGQHLWGLFQQFAGKQLYALYLLPAKGKLGFDLEPAQELIGFWSNDGGEIVFGDTERPTTGGGLTKISLESMTPLSVNGSGKIGHGGAGSIPTESSGNGASTLVEKRRKRPSEEPGA